MYYNFNLDKFKTINDTWGHPEGDRAFGLVADALTKVAKKFDAKVFRVCGDEFQIIADTSDEKEAEKIEKELKMSFQKLNLEMILILRLVLEKCCITEKKKLIHF